MADLAAVIAAHLAEWTDSPAYVELAIYGTDDAAAIAAVLREFCGRELGAEAAGGLFHQSSVGAVTGIRLADGRAVVVKAHQPWRGAAALAEIVRVQRWLADRRLFATPVVAGPAPIGLGHAVVEGFVDAGTSRDAHEPAVRRALARALHEIVDATRPLVEASTLGLHILADPPSTLWPRPHSRLFDFDASSAGAGWIDDVARAARDRMAGAGALVIGHGDWRAEHVRFAGERPVVAFDWDSLCRVQEPALVGTTAHGFTADWTRAEEIAPLPTLDEARAFVADYEEARGEAFDAAERRLAGAVYAYASAYQARCGWAGGDRGLRDRHPVGIHGVGLLDL